MVQKVEQHINKRQIVPSTQTKIQNIDKVEVQPHNLREEQHIIQTTVVPETRKQTQDINKKVIQPIIKDVIQPVHILVKPVFQEGIKPIIVKGEQYGQAINQGVQNLPASYLGEKQVKEVLGQTKVRQSIYRTSTLPVQYTPVQYKPEIATNVGISTSRYSVNTVPGLNTTIGIGEINAGTTVRPSIIRNSVLPTINAPQTVLNAVYGPTTKTIAQGGVVTTQNLGIGSTIVKPTINLGTTVGALGATTTTTTTATQYGVGSVGYNTSIMGVGGGVQDYAADVTYSTKPNPTLNTVATTGYNTSIMGVGGGVQDFAADVTYSTKPNATLNTVGTGVVNTTSLMGVGGGVQDFAADVTYSTKPDSNLAYQQAF